MPSKFRVGQYVVPIEPSNRSQPPVFVRQMEAYVGAPTRVRSIDNRTGLWLYHLQSNTFVWHEDWLVETDVRLELPVDKPGENHDANI